MGPEASLPHGGGAFWSYVNYIVITVSNRPMSPKDPILLRIRSITAVASDESGLKELFQYYMYIYITEV